MPAGLFTQIAHLALDPEITDLDFEKISNTARQSGDGDRFDFVHDLGILVAVQFGKDHLTGTRLKRADHGDIL